MESRIEVEAHASDGIMKGDAAVQGKEEGRSVFRIALGLDLAVCRCAQSALGRGYVTGREAQMEFRPSKKLKRPSLRLPPVSPLILALRKPSSIKSPLLFHR